MFNCVTFIKFKEFERIQFSLIRNLRTRRIASPMSDVLGLIVERIHIRLVLEALESLSLSVGYKNFVSKSL